MSRIRRRLSRRPLPVDAHPLTGKRPQDLTSAQLRDRLITDAVEGRATPLLWLVAAVERISRLDGITVDEAFLAIEVEVTAQGGIMPAAPGR